jgi:hypothetical protein
VARLPKPKGRLVKSAENAWSVTEAKDSDFAFFGLRERPAAHPTLNTVAITAGEAALRRTALISK